MIGDYLKHKIREDNGKQTSSNLLPNNFMLNKPLLIDPSFKILIKGTSIKIPTSVTPVGYVNWTLYGTDKFEDILLDDKSYKFLYDSVNDNLYFLQLVDTSNREDINTDSVHVGQNVYDAITDVMEIPDKTSLLRIYVRDLSEDVAEYLFVEYDKNLLQRCWAGVIIELSLIE